MLELTCATVLDTLSFYKQALRAFGTALHEPMTPKVVDHNFFICHENGTDHQNLLPYTLTKQYCGKRLQWTPHCLFYGFITY